MTHPQNFRRSDLVRIATEAMKERGLEPEFPANALQELSAISGPGHDSRPTVRDPQSRPKQNTCPVRPSTRRAARGDVSDIDR